MGSHFNNVICEWLLHYLHFKMSLTGWECDKVFAVRGKLSQEAGRLFNIDQGVVGEHVQEKASICAHRSTPIVSTHASAGGRATVKFPHHQTKGNILWRDFSRDKVFFDPVVKTQIWGFHVWCWWMVFGRHFTGGLSGLELVHYLQDCVNIQAKFSLRKKIILTVFEIKVI